MTKATLAISVFSALLALSAAADPYFPIEAKVPRAVESRYSPKICNVLKAWPPADFPATVAGENPLWMRGIRTPGDEGYIGVEKRMLIHAPLAKVTALLNDFEHYKDRIPDLKEVRVLGRAGNRILTAWETKSPVFFVPNTKYNLAWTIDTSAPDRAVYRFQLLSSNHLKASDTLIVLESRGDSTLLSTFDFFQLDLGFIGAFASAGKVWKKTFEGFYLGDIALKTQLEHPDWSAKQIKQEAERLLDRNPVEPLQFVSNAAFDATPGTKVSATALPAPTQKTL